MVLSLLMQLNQEAQDLRVVELVPDSGGHFLERPAPLLLESRTVVLLDIYGSLLYAGAKTLQVRLPDPNNAENTAVVLRLRGRAMLGSTSYNVLADYARQLESVGASTSAASTRHSWASCDVTGPSSAPGRSRSSRRRRRSAPRAMPPTAPRRNGWLSATDAPVAPVAP
ncbi:MAG: hypothetical protein ABI934_12220, partial [Actinomycetota bacterium]